MHSPHKGGTGVIRLYLKSLSVLSLAILFSACAGGPLFIPLSEDTALGGDELSPSLTFLTPSGTKAKDTLTLYGTCTDLEGISISVTGDIESTVSITCTDGGFLGSITLSGSDGTKTVTATVDLSQVSSLSQSTLSQSALSGTLSESITLSKTPCYDPNVGLISPFADGDGTAGDPYIICSAFQLNNVRDHIGDPNVNFEMKDNIDLTDATRAGGDFDNSGSGWEPIGDDFTTFEGSFDGLNFTINGLFINRGGSTEIGLFGTTGTGSGAGATVKNLILTDVSITGGNNTGGFIGKIPFTSTIENCHITGTVDSSGIGIGGLIGGSLDGTLSDSSANVTVTGGSLVGGLVGDASTGSITDSFATGDVSGSTKVGGLVGNTGGASISNSYATGDVSATLEEFGGLVGNANLSNVSDSYATGDVTGGAPSHRAGGLLGSANNATVSDSYATGSVSVGASSQYAGGLIGEGTSASCTNCYATGSVSGDADVGGLIGDASNSPGISNSYATGNVSALSSPTGGLIGRGSGATISDSYATGDVEGTSETGGLIGNGTSATITDSYATGSITGSSQVGGLVGDAPGIDIDDSYATGDVDGTGNDVGGLVGATDGTIDDSYATGDLSGGSLNTGGLVGDGIGANGLDITHSYYAPDSGAAANVEGPDSVGGLLGIGDGDTTILQSYSTGHIAGLGALGGLVGFVSGVVTIEDCYATGNVTATGPSGTNIGGIVGSAGDGSNIHRVYATGNISAPGGKQVGGLLGLGPSGAFSNGFFTGTLTGSTEVGGIVGCVVCGGGGLSQFDWMFWIDDPSDSAIACVGDTPDFCNTSEAITYFYDSSSAIYSPWNFTTTWQENVGDFPTLQ